MSIHFDDIFAVTAPGLENSCAEEISALLGSGVKVEKGGITFAGSLADLYRVNLGSRLASRVVVRLGSVRADDFPELYRKVKKLPWGRFIKGEMPVVVRASSRHSRLNHTDRIAHTVGEAINGALGRHDLSGSDASQLVIARFVDDVCQLSVDSSGELLHRRGYRTEISRAPLRETLAAGLLTLLGWQGQVPLYDPMCGSGTFLLEAAMLAGRRAPGRDRSFAFQQWPKYRPGLWRNLLDETRRQELKPGVLLCGSDNDAEVIAVAERNADRAGIGDDINYACAAIADVEAPAASGLVICNPPYGVRIGEPHELADLYRQLGRLYRETFKGWRGALFCPSSELVAETGVNFRVVAELVNGGLATKLFACDL